MQVVWPELTQQELMIALLLVLVPLTLLLMLSAWDERRARKEVRTALLTRARQRSEEGGMNPSEERVWRRMVLESGEIPGLHAFEAHVERMLKEGVKPEVLKGIREKGGFRGPSAGHRLRSTRECAIGQDVTIEVANRVWKCGILDIDETRIVVKAPDDAAGDLGRGAAVRVSFWRETDGFYHFDTVVRSISKDRVVRVELEHAPGLRRREAREFHRESLTIRAEAVLAGTGGGETAPVALRILDLSAGGFLAESNPALSEGAFYRLKLMFPGREILHAARILRTDAKGTHGELVDMSIQERDDLHREILKASRSRES